jgi:hypothetical protein
VPIPHKADGDVRFESGAVIRARSAQCPLANGGHSGMRRLTGKFGLVSGRGVELSGAGELRFRLLVLARSY